MGSSWFSFNIRKSKVPFTADHESTVTSTSNRNCETYQNKRGKLIFLNKEFHKECCVLQITAYDIVRAYIDRIRVIQPYLNVYVDERFSSALAEAQEIDRVLDSVSRGQRSLPDGWKEERAPFLGVPFAIKESMKFVGFHNSTGIVERKDYICTRTATSVENMLKAGGILLCNTNVSEGCMWFES